MFIIGRGYVPFPEEHDGGRQLALAVGELAHRLGFRL